jgi:hypothetical protein
MKAFIILVLLAAVAVAGFVWYQSDKNSHAGQVKSDLQSAVAETGALIKDKMADWKLKPDDIKDELKRTGKVVRVKAKEAGAAIADATADARVTTAIKAKLLKDQSLASLSISVSTTSGLVTLSGTAATPENISRAIQLAMETDGVTQVVSTLQVKN